MAAGGGHLTYLHGNVLELGLRNATHLFMHSTCFRLPLIQSILQLAASSSTVGCILKYGEMDHGERHDAFAKWGPMVHRVAAPGTWEAGAVGIHRRAGLPGSEVSARSQTANCTKNAEGHHSCGRVDKGDHRRGTANRRGEALHRLKRLVIRGSV